MSPATLHNRLTPLKTMRAIAVAGLTFLVWLQPQERLHAVERVKPVGWVNDFAGVMDRQAAQRLERVLDELERRTGAEVAVVTVPTVADGDIEHAAVDLFHAWGIGKKQRDNGVLILCAVQDRRVRIEVGYGLEAILPDAKSGRIIREQMIPYFRSGDLSTGLVQGALAVAGAIAQDAKVALETTVPMAPSPPVEPGTLLVLGQFLPLLFFVLLLLVLTRSLGRHGSRYGSWYGFGGGYSSGGFSGGFGGFGGGASGGGGAGGSW